ncbi:MAG: DUF5946 family protein [Candidatus Limnocylindria bacterium]
MAFQCESCGATYTDGGSCQGRFDHALALEFTDPEYGTVHHLTVAAFMLQHDRYSHAGWLAARSLLSDFVHGHLQPQDARGRSRQTDASIARPAGFRGFGEIRWTRTIAEIGFEDAAKYRQGVRAWAASVLDDSEAAAG